MIKIALTGNPLSKSLSDIIYQKLSILCGEKIEFKKIETTDLKKTIKELIKGNYDGFFITIPYKKEILKYSIKDEIANETGCGNCIKIKNKKLYLTNTDYIALEKLTSKYNIKDKSILIIGNGASAQTAYTLFKKNNPKKIDIMARDFRKNKWFKKFKNINFIPFKNKISENYDIIINATPIGMYVKRKIDINIKKAHLIIDFAYSKNGSFFTRLSRKKKVKLINGFDILVNQALYGLKFITGKNFSSYTKKLIKYLKGVI